MPNLTVKQVNILAKSKPSKTSDGNGLLFVVPNRGEPYWSLRYSFNGKRREKSLGKFEELTLAEARGEAETIRAMLREGVDPLSLSSLTKHSGMTFNELFRDMYENKLLKRLERPDIPKSKYDREIAKFIGHLKVEQVNAFHIRDILNIITDSGRPTVANDVLDLLNNLFKHAIQLNITLNNPASAFGYKDAGGHEPSRQRALTNVEIEQAFSIFRKYPESFTRDNYLACCLLVVLGVRKSELIQAPWSEFDLDNAVWHLPKERTKKKFRAIKIPLLPLAVEWLKELKVRSHGSDYVFPARRKSKKPYMGPDTINSAINSLFGIDKSKKIPPPNRMGDLEHFRVHDLRRTFRSIGSELKFQDDHLERCLNHKISKLDEIYNKHDFFEQRKEIHRVIANYLKPLISPIDLAV